MSAALVERTGVVVKRRKLLGGLFAVGAGIFGIVAAFPLLRSLGPRARDTRSRRPTGARGRCLVDSNGRPVRTGHARRRRHHDRLSPDTVSAGRVHHRRGPGRRPDRAHPGVGRSPSRPSRAARPGPPTATWPTPRCAPTSAARSASTSSSSSCWSAPATSRCSTCATAPCPSSARPPGRCPSCPSYIDDGLPRRHGAGYDQAVGPGFWERTRRERSTDRRPRPSAAPRRPSAPTGTSARSSTSSTTASASPRAAASSSTRSSRTTGRSCWARSPCTPSWSCWPPASSCRSTSSPRASRSSTTAATSRSTASGSRRPTSRRSTSPSTCAAAC